MDCQYPHCIGGQNGTICRVDCRLPDEQPPKRQPMQEEMLRQMRERRIDPDRRGAFVDGWISAEQAHGIRSSR